MAKKPSAPAVMLNLTIGHWVARLIYVAAKLKLADLLKDGPRTTAQLATATGVHAPALYRVLRALASVGVFAETKGGRFKLTPLARPPSGATSPAQCAPGQSWPTRNTPGTPGWTSCTA